MNLLATIKFFVASIIQTLPKVGVNVFPGHDGRVTSDKKIICKSCQRFRGGNRDFFSN